MRDNYGHVYLGRETPPRPFQLPPKVEAFVGRESEVNRIMAALEPQSSSTLAVVSGLAGSGKSAVAVHASHLAARRDGGSFPGGVLFADLRGYRDVRADSEAVLRTFVHSLGHPRDQAMADRQEWVATYQTLLAQQAEQHGRMLILLENVSSAESVRDLLPAGPSHRVLITSRHRLGLLSAVQVKLDTMTESEAEQLLVAHAGPEAVRCDPGATREVIGFCGRLPLALRIVAALFVDQVVSGMAEVAEVAEDLRDSKTRLDELSCEDGASGEAEAVRSAFDLSYRRLPEEQKRMFRMLSLDFGPLYNVEKAAALADVDLRTARRTLQGLARACLVDSTSSLGRYQFHDLVQLFSVECCGGVADEVCDAARKRLLALQQEMGKSAVGVINELVRESDRFTNVHDALEWCDAEHAGMMSAIRWAQAKGYDQIVMELAVVFGTYYEYQGRRRTSFDMLKVGFEAGLRVGDKNVPRIGAAIGGLLQRMGLPDEAGQYNRRADRSARAVGDETTVLNVMVSEGYLAAKAGDKRRAAILWGEAMFRAFSVGDENVQSTVLEALGTLLRSEGKVDGAIDMLKGALALSDGSHGRARAAIECELGFAYFLAGDLGAAVEHLERAVRRSADVGHAKGELRARLALIQVWVRRNDLKAVRAETTTALRLAELLGDDELAADLKRRLG